MDNLLIVNADDFGLCKAQNYGILEASLRGVVTSTTAMMNIPAVGHAARLSAANPALAVGMHFVLTLGRPLSPMPNLVRHGELGKWLWERAEAGTLPLEEIEQELACQFARFIQLFGRPPTHIDSHHHAHLIPQIFPLVASFAREKGLPLRLDREALRNDGIVLHAASSTEGFSSDFYGEDVSESRFLSTLDKANEHKQRSLEVMCHPAFIDHTLLASKYCYPRLTELEVLTSATLKPAIAERGFRLGSFSDL